MLSITETKLVTLGQLMSSASGMSESRIANLAGRDGAFFRRLREGKSCRLDTAGKMLIFFSRNWPAGIDWPNEIERPVLLPESQESPK